MNGLWVGHSCFLPFRGDVPTEEAVPELPPRSGCFPAHLPFIPQTSGHTALPKPEAAEGPSFVCFIQLFLLPPFTASEIMSP